MIKKLVLAILVLPVWHVAGRRIKESDPDLDLLKRSLEILATETGTSQKPTAVERDQRCVYLEQKIHELINSERVKQGFSPLELNDKLMQAARNHSDDMATRNYWNHRSPEGHDVYWRYQQVGFTDSIRIGNTIYPGAENIFKISKTNMPLQLDQDAHDIVDGWMHSTEGHRENILTPYWKREGIGVAIVTSHADRETTIKIYVTENFC